MGESQAEAALKNIAEISSLSVADNLTFQVLNTIAVGQKCEGICGHVFIGYDWAITASGLICAACIEFLEVPPWGNA